MRTGLGPKAALGRPTPLARRRRPSRCACPDIQAYEQSFPSHFGPFHVQKHMKNTCEDVNTARLQAFGLLFDVKSQVLEQNHLATARR